MYWKNRGELGATLLVGLTELPGLDARGIHPGVWSPPGTKATGLVRCFFAFVGFTISVFSS